MNNIDELVVLVTKQIEDLPLWDIPSTDRESALQDALKALHVAIEQLADGLDS